MIKSESLNEKFCYNAVFDKISQVTKAYLGIFQEFDASNKEVVFTGAMFRQLYNSNKTGQGNGGHNNAHDDFKNRMIKALTNVCDENEINELSVENNMFSDKYRRLYGRLSNHFALSSSQSSSSAYEISVHNDKIWEKWFSLLKTLCEDKVISR